MPSHGVTFINEGVINDTLTEDEMERVWKAAKQHADQLHEQHPSRQPPPLKQYL
jgi:hypothetical protein